MFKLLAGVAISAGVLASVVLPGHEAQAASPVCARAIELINVAVDGGDLNEETSRSLAERLTGLADLTAGDERAAIIGYADALRDAAVTDLTAVTDQLNRACA
ncbi:hypothetical protein AB0L82_31990 [Nocardia sp. NPDC052001]|uniref:hypothetical protein n=1 Tax=Nocardia sp. NPDC052001 TaxID=3154853 RepID=UPI003425CD72